MEISVTLLVNIYLSSLFLFIHRCRNLYLAWKQGPLLVRAWTFNRITTAWIEAVSLVEKPLMSNSFSECYTEPAGVHPRSSMFCKFHSFLFEVGFKAPVLTTVVNGVMEPCFINVISDVKNLDFHCGIMRYDTVWSGYISHLQIYLWRCSFRL
jgi:hypothetical protein